MRRLVRNIADSPFLNQGAFIAIIIYLDFFNFLTGASPSTEKLGKYLYFIWALAWYGTLLLTSHCRQGGLTGQNVLIALAGVAFVPFGFQLLSGAEASSYASAFAAVVVFCASGLLDVSRYQFRTEELRAKVQLLLLLLCGLYVAELIVRNYSGLAYFDLAINQTNHIKSICFIGGICLAYLARNQRSLLIGLALLAASLVLRPSSSALFGIALCLPLAHLMRSGWLRMSEAICYVVLVTAAVFPILLYVFPEMQLWIVDLESWMKEDVLAGTSTTYFRLAVQDLAFERMQESSLLFGEFFSAATAVQLDLIFPWWADEFNALGLATIHSDFVIMMLQGGVVGYLAFNLALALIIRSGFRSLRRARILGLAAPLQGMGVIIVVAMIFYSSSNPLLQYFGVSHVAWYLVGVGAIAGRIMSYGYSRGSRRELSEDRSGPAFA